MYGDTTGPAVRWASTWSGPFWASSSITKIAVSFHSGPFETCSTIRPRARSFEATHACGVNVPTVVPVVWSSPRLMTMNRGIVPFLANSSYSARNVSARSVSRTFSPAFFGSP